MQHAFAIVDSAPKDRPEDRLTDMFFRRPKIAPRSQELVFLDADDDLGTIRSKLEAEQR